jgi:four helix bundle protein
MDEQQFKDKTKNLALRSIRLIETLPKNQTSSVIGKQLLRSATSVGANYRAACRGKSPADMISKLSIVEEEADESMYWMELLVEAGLVSEAKLRNLMNEMNEVVAMTVVSIKTLRAHNINSANPKPEI